MTIFLVVRHTLRRNPFAATTKAPTDIRFFFPSVLPSVTLNLFFTLHTNTHLANKYLCLRGQNGEVNHSEPVSIIMS